MSEIVKEAIEAIEEVRRDLKLLTFDIGDKLRDTQEQAFLKTMRTKLQLQHKKLGEVINGR